MVSKVTNVNVKRSNNENSEKDLVEAMDDVPDIMFQSSKTPTGGNQLKANLAD